MNAEVEALAHEYVNRWVSKGLAVILIPDGSQVHCMAFAPAMVRAAVVPVGDVEMEIGRLLAMDDEGDDDDNT